MSLNVLKTVIEAGGEEKLLIDGTETYPGYRIDWCALVESIIHEGEYEFFVCSCGEAGCAELFTPQEIIHDKDTVTWRVIEPKPEGEYHFDRDQYLDNIYEAFIRADGFKQGKWEDFSIGPYGFFLTTFTKCLAKLTRWRELRKQGIHWIEIAKGESSRNENLQTNIAEEMLAKLEDIERILRKCNETSYLPELLECQDLLINGRYVDFWKRLESPIWWGREDEPISLANLAFDYDDAEDLSRDLVVYERALLTIASALRRQGVVSEDAEEWVFQWMSWYPEFPA